MDNLIRLPLSDKTVEMLYEELTECDIAMEMIMEQMSELNQDMLEVLKRYEHIKEQIKCREKNSDLTGK